MNAKVPWIIPALEIVLYTKADPITQQSYTIAMSMNRSTKIARSGLRPSISRHPQTGDTCVQFGKWMFPVLGVLWPNPWGGEPVCLNYAEKYFSLF